MGAKRDDATHTEKLIALCGLLSRNSLPMSLGRMASELRCSKQTIIRLIGQIEKADIGKVLRAKEGRQSIYSLTRTLNECTPRLNADGQLNLALCREFLADILPPAMHRQMEANLLECEGWFRKEQGRLRGVGGALGKGQIDYAPYEKILNRLISAITSDRVIELEYRARRDGPKKRFSFAPKRLINYRECIYVDGWRVSDTGNVESLYENSVRLALQRIVSCILTRRSSRSLPEPLRTQTGLGVMDGEPFEVIARFTPFAATYAAERRWSGNQKMAEEEDGSIVLTLTARNEAECIAWALGFGDQIVILQPDWLREAMRRKIASMAALYAGSCA